GIPAPAVGDVDGSRYHVGMKTKPHPNAGPQSEPNGFPSKFRSVSNGGVPVASLNPPPAAAPRGYPSLCDDGQPYFPRRPRIERSRPVEPAWLGFPWIRLIAVLVLIVIMAALAAGM